MNQSRTPTVLEHSNRSNKNKIERRSLLKAISQFLLFYAVTVIIIYVVSIFLPVALNFIVYFSIALLIVLVGYLIKHYLFSSRAKN